MLLWPHQNISQFSVMKTPAQNECLEAFRKSSEYAVIWRFSKLQSGQRKQLKLSCQHLKALVFLYAFEQSVDCQLLSSFCDDSNLHMSLFKYVLSTMGVSKETISKFLTGNRFHVKLRILSPKNCKRILRVKS